MTGLASSCSHIFSTFSRAAARSLPSISISISLPWRTSPMPVKPKEASALPIALPCGSSTPALRLTWTRAFIDQPSLNSPRRFEVGRVALGEDAKPTRDLLITLGDLLQILAEAVLVELLAGADIPEPHVV